MNAHIKKLLENLAKSFEKDLEKVEALFEYAKRKISEETNKKEPALSVSALHAVRAHLTTEQGKVGKEINVVFFGKDPSRDTNASSIKEILADFWNNPESRKKVIEEGKIIVLKVADGDPKKDFHKMYKPLVTLDEYVEVDGEVVPTKGKLWDPTTNEDPLPRDNRTHLDEEGETTNWNYTHPLKPNWKTTLFGIGYFEDTPNIIKKIQVRFYGDIGDPQSGQFVCKHISFFKSYKLKVQVAENMSTEECYVLTAKSKPVLAEEPGADLDVVTLMDGINTNWMIQQEAKGNEPKPLIPIIELSDLKEWHVERRARKDENGEILKAPSGWDLTNWDEYCLIDQVTYLGKRQFTETYAPAVIQHDSTGRETMFVNYDDNLDLDIPIPSDILICVKTGRGTTKYDREAKAKIENSDDPDLSISICGTKTLMSYEKIEFPKELTGDL